MLSSVNQGNWEKIAQAQGRERPTTHLTPPSVRFGGCPGDELIVDVRAGAEEGNPHLLRGRDLESFRAVDSLETVEVTPGCDRLWFRWVAREGSVSWNNLE